MMSYLEIEMVWDDNKDDKDVMDDKDVIKRKDEMSEITKILKTISIKIQDMLKESVQSPAEDSELKTLHTRYDDILALKDSYFKLLKKEINDRELDKTSVFNEANLNIQLCKFKGYGSPMDVYTFKSNFEKLHRRVPSLVLPEMLKNNYLEGSALDLVQSVKSMEEIWTRLKTAYGDPKVLLSKKFSEIDNVPQLVKSREVEKVSDGLNKVISVMKDLVNLALTHEIEEKLYHGDGLERVFKVIGDNRMTRWLSTSCEEKMDEKKTWESVIKFLEKELEIQQQKFIIADATSIQNLFTSRKRR